MTNTACEWVADGSYETVTAATRRIREIEGRATGGIFLSMFVEIDFGGDDEVLGRFEYTGKHTLYVIKRRVM
jgi:hypothetical protein